MTATTQGSGNHRAGTEVDKEFMNIYEQEVVTKRTLPPLEILSKEDVVVDQKADFLISYLKNFFKSHEVRLDDEEEELIGDQTDVLKVSKVNDEGKDKVLSILCRSLWFIPTVTRSRTTPLRTTLRSN